MSPNYDDSSIMPVPDDGADRDLTGRPANRRVLTASSLTGDRVRNSAGEDLGKIEDIVIDLAGGEIAYAVLSFGGFLGIGDKLFAVPWRALTLNTRQREFILNVDRKRLKEAPGFDPDHWPDMADPAWGARIDEFYGSRRTSRPR